MSRSIHETLANARGLGHRGDDPERALEQIARKSHLKGIERDGRALSALADDLEQAPSSVRATIDEHDDDVFRSREVQMRTRLANGHVDYDTLYNLAVCREHVGDDDEAIAFYTQAIAHVRVDGGIAHDVDAWYNRALLLRRRGQRDEARADFDWVIDHAREADAIAAARRQLLVIDD